MAEDVRRIRSFVALLVRRERALLVVRLGARAVGLLVVLALFMALAATVGLDRGPAWLLAVALAGVGGWVAIALPLLLEWRPTGDALRQARRVEALRPELRGRLLTAVEHTGAPRGGESEALLGLVVRRAATALAGLRPAEVHPARPAVRQFLLAGGAWTLALLVLAAAGPGRVLAFWFGGAQALAEAVGVEIAAPEDLALVGDIVVTYRYPDYTGLEPKTVPNGTGDVSAPPGTVVEVSAKSADAVEAAGLVAYEERLEAAVAEDARTVTGRFGVGTEAGAWRFVLYRGAGDTQGDAERSRDFAIEPQQDLPPDVMVEAEADRIEVAADGTIRLPWQARDDFGVRKVGLAVDGKDADRVLDRPDRRRAELQGTVRVTPRELGLVPGDRVKLSIVAWDNDTVSGSKKGASRPIEVVVLGAAGLAEQAAQRREELLKQMVPVLARHLTDPWPPGDTAGELAAWGEAVAARYRPLAQTVERLWAGMDTGTQDRAIVQRVLDTGKALVRYTQTAFEPDADSVPSDEAFRMTSELHQEAVVALEDAILAMHTMQRIDALAEVSEQADQLENAADRLAEALAQEDPDLQELLAQLDMLERMMERLAEAAAKLGDSGLREYVNQRMSETRDLMDEIRKAIAEGRLDDARDLAKRLEQLVREMSEGIRQEMQDQADAAQQADDSAEELKEELRRLADEQKKLQSEVRALREQDRQGTQELQDLWEQLQQRAAQHLESCRGYATGLGAAERPFFEQERAASGVEQAEDLRDAVTARDAAGAREAVDEAQGAWSGVRRALEAQLQLHGTLDGPGRRELGVLLQQLAEIERLLRQLDEAEAGADPETMRRSQELEGRQRDLDNQLQQARERAKALEQQFPVRPEGMREALDEAHERMEQASEDLSEGQPMQAEGSQGVAGQRIEDAIQALERAQQQSRSQQQGRRGQPPQQQEGEQQGQEDGEGQEFSEKDLEIPGREEFRTPEEYRRALLEGMDGEVPEEYRAMKRRYFEELVSQ